MVGFHIADASAVSVADAVIYGFIAWGLLILSMGIIFAVLKLITRIRNKKS